MTRKTRDSTDKRFREIRLNKFFIRCQKTETRNKMDITIIITTEDSSKHTTYPFLTNLLDRLIDELVKSGECKPYFEISHIERGYYESGSFVKSLKKFVENNSGYSLILIHHWESKNLEDLFFHLALQFKPERILLAGKDPGVWEDYPDCTSLIKEITPADLPTLQKIIRQSGAPDVTGGMEAKVKKMLQLSDKLPALETVIFSGEDPGRVQSVLGGDTIGTILHS